MKKLMICFIALCFLLSGCRESPVLQQIVYEENNEIDEENQSTDNDEENDDEDEDLSPEKEEDDASNKQDQTRNDAYSGDDNSDSDTTYDTTYVDTANAMGTASDGSSNETNNNNNGSNQSADQSSDNDDGQDEGDEDSDDGQNGEAEDGSEGGSTTEPTDGETYKQVVDDRGKTVDIVENVDSVTAVGEAAIIVAMLGGTSKLTGTSASFFSSASGVFSTSGIKQWWSGDGDSAISSANFNALISADVDVCIEISGQSTFTSSQIATLEENDIAYFVIPSLSSISNIKSAVTLVGKVLGGDATSKASSYSSWVDNALSKVSGGSGTTLYVGEWDDSATWSIDSSSGTYASGSGMAVAKTGGTMLKECMSKAGVTNNASDGYYINPLKDNYYIQSVSGSYKYRNTSYKMTDGLGGSSYKCIIVASSSIKEKIQSDFHWDVYGMVKVNGVNFHGFLDGSGNALLSYIEDDYSIYVNPDGVGSWTEGSVETILEVVWLACRVNGTISESSMKSMVSDFYSTFYGSSNTPSL
ncbi:MAG: hypothetical protein LUG12_09075 [Erysipelotrichaceae bacterium]|nr:hypothetical protein [Erysipelotrichaceae bacterium]